MPRPEPVENVPELVIAGALIGALVARFLRRRGLRFEWPLLAVPLVAVLARTDPEAVVLAGTATLVALLGGWRRHWLDIDAGGDLAAYARDRVGIPGGVRRRLARRAATHGRAVGRRGLLIGVDEHGAVRIPLGGCSGCHTLVAGATGSGKTVTQAWFARHAIAHGHGAIAVDPKGDALLRATLIEAADRAGCAFVEWTPEGPSVYNPYARGSDTELVDKLLAGETWTEPHYLRQAQRFLGHVVRALRATGRPIDLATIVEHFTVADLELLSRRMNGGGSGLQRYLDSLTQAQIAQLSGARDRLAILAESDLAPWITCRDDAPALDLADIVATGCVAYVRLDADRRPLSAQMLGAAVVQDLITIVAERQADPLPTLVLLDEFSALGAPNVARLFQRGRSAGISLLLGIQELASLAAADEELLKDVLGNVTTVIAHRQNVPDSAQLIADMAGTEGAWATTRRTDLIGDTEHGTRSRVYEYRLHPDRLKRLPTGCAAVISPGEGHATVAEVFHAPVADLRLYELDELPTQGELVT